MDAAVKHEQRSAGPKRPGRIIVVRHGRPTLDRNAGPKLDWRGYRAWWASYEGASLAPGQGPPTKLRAAVANDALILSSMRPRAMETAAMIANGRAVASDAVFNEAPLPPPEWPSSIRYLPKTWNKIARLAWVLGHHGGDEPQSAARVRAEEAARRLVEAASDGRDVVLAAHGWFNRMLRPALIGRGWRCIKDGGDGYWSFRVYARRR